MNDRDETLALEAVVPSNVFRPKSFSTAVKAAGFVYVSGTVALHPDGHLVGPGDFRKQAEFTFDTLRKILKAAKSSPKKLVRVSIYLTDAANYDALNELWTGLVKDCETLPTRVTVVSQLVIPGLLIELDAVALV